MLTSPRLKAGMTIGVVAPSSPSDSRSNVLRGVAALEQLGLKLELGRHVWGNYGHLAGADAERAADLLDMLERPDVDAVICLGGGYGALRTAMALDRARLANLRNAPARPFIGYSDITVLHALLQRELGWVTFYGPMLHSFARASEYTISAFRRALLEAEPFEIAPDPDDRYTETLVPGKAEGQLMGGCLALITALIGTPWELDLRDKIFCFEDIDETPARLERMLCQLIAGGKLDGCAGIVIGEHTGCEPRGARNSLYLEQVWDDLLRPLAIPTLYHLPIGHGKHLATLPLGARAELDASAKRLRVLEPGVR